jgi:hypothetical protein
MSRALASEGSGFTYFDPAAAKADYFLSPLRYGKVVPFQSNAVFRNRKAFPV